MQAQVDVYLSPSEPRLPVCKLKGLSRMLARTAGMSCASEHCGPARLQAGSPLGSWEGLRIESAAVFVPRGEGGL